LVGGSILHAGTFFLKILKLFGLTVDSEFEEAPRYESYLRPVTLLDIVTRIDAVFRIDVIDRTLLFGCRVARPEV
jgi:hypothetical protein